MSAIYRITNEETGGFYIGSTMNAPLVRWSQHKAAMRMGRGDCPILQNAWNKYGEDALGFSVLAEFEGIEEPVLRVIETMYLRNLSPKYNVKKNATTNPMYGRHHKESTKRLLSKLRSGKNNIWYGVHRTGKDAPFYGRKHKPESNLKRSVKLRGENNPMARLTANDVRNIRERYAAGGVTQRELGEEYGVHGDYVSMIVTRRAWRHI